MTGRRAILVCASIAAGLALIELLVSISGVKWADVLARFAVLDWVALPRLAVLMAISMYLSSRKWQLVDRAMRRAADRRVSEGTSFVLTSIGVALGQLVPVQIASSLARTVGTWAYGSAIRRGTLSTLIEQASDLLIVCFLALASAATILLHGNVWTWLQFAVVVWAIAMLGVPWVLPAIRRLAAVMGGGAHQGNWRKAIAELSHSGLLSAGLARRLMALSTARFVVLVLMAGQTTAAIHGDVPLWRLAAAMPIVVLSSAIGITPGGLGFTEFSYSAMLAAYGTSLSTATQWALANRLLTSAAAFAIAIIVVPVLLVRRPIYTHQSDIARPACE